MLIIFVNREQKEEPLKDWIMAPNYNYQRVGNGGSAAQSSVEGIGEYLDDLDGSGVGRDGGDYYLGNNVYTTENATSGNTTWYTTEEIQLMVSQVLNGTVDHLPSEISNEQKEILERVNDSPPGITCYLKNWLIDQKKLIPGYFKNLNFFFIDKWIMQSHCFC